MPAIESIAISEFRNIDEASLSFSPGFNTFYGDNGAGKTSFLEALYYLALGKSFRAAYTQKLIQHGSEQFYICAQIQHVEHGVSQTIGISRNQSGERILKIDGEKQLSMSAAAKLIPVQFMSPISYRFFHDGSKIRRQYLDWGVFHVKPFFLSHWQSFQRLLKQRNAALKQRHSTSPWDDALIQSAEVVDEERRSIFTALEPLCLDQLALLLPHYSFQLRYQRGWSNTESLADLLRSYQARDQQLGFTYYGPQRADFQLLYNKTPIQDTLSQGQQKLAAYALQLALGILLHRIVGQNPVYLIDDLPSELDKANRNRVLSVLEELKAQTFLTSITATDLQQNKANNKMFHVEHGRITML